MGLFGPTPIQVRDRKIKDLQLQLQNERSARRNDLEAMAAERGEEAAGLREELGRSLARLRRYGGVVGRMWAWVCRLKAKIADLKKRCAELEDLAAVQAARLKKDSTNSSKPPSSDGLKRRTASTREKSGRKPGRPAGHKGATMLPLAAGEPEIIDVKTGACGCGGEINWGSAYSARRKIDIEVTVKAAEQRAYGGVCAVCGKPFRAEFGADFASPQSYGGGIRALAMPINEHGCVGDRKTAEIMNSICGGLTGMSPGTVFNFRMKLAESLCEEAEAIKRRLIEAKVLCVDETGVRVGGKLNWATVYAAGDFVLYEHSEKRGAHCKDGGGILAFFVGILMHDHFRPYYNKKAMSHAECNQHILRYLKPAIEIQSRKWAQSMAAFLKDSNGEKMRRIADGGSPFFPEELAAMDARHIEILDQGDAEYRAATEGKKNIARFRDERRLLARLRKHAAEHLRFLHDFDVPFANNLAEQGVHCLKGKTRVSGGFRTDKGAKAHMLVASVIASARRRGMNVLDTIKDAYAGRKIFDSGQPPPAAGPPAADPPAS
jgi:transposase